MVLQSAQLWDPLGGQPLHEGDLLWQPSAQLRRTCRMGQYLAWLEREHGRRFAGYAALQRWSVVEIDPFWRSVVQFFGVGLATPAAAVLDTPAPPQPAMPGAQWFQGASLNYARQALQHPAHTTALIARTETGPREAVTYGQLTQAVANVAQAFRALGVGKGDRVVAVLPNGQAAVVAFLACASLGAVWSSCPPEFGTGSVLDRFRQIEPKLLIAVAGYQYGGKHFDRTEALDQIAQGLPSLVATVVVGAQGAAVPGAGQAPSISGKGIPFEPLLQGDATPHYEVVPFEHPLWILYSSGTTGLPKALVQGHGGIVLEHLKALGLHGDIGPESRFFWYSTTGWMMWNYLVSGLLVGATIVLYDGNPGYPDLNALWQMAAVEKVTHFGVSAAYLLACRKAGIEPGQNCDLSALCTVGSTGSPLPLEGFEWVYRAVKRDVLLGSISGGTDLCTAFVGQCPLLPVHAGEIQCTALGASVEAWNEMGEPLVDQVGELVITQPMPSMPLFFWGDDNGEKYRASYFEMFPGIWRHGDFVRITARGSVVITGRSDSTLNRGGVRMGSSEFYRVVEGLDAVTDSLVIDSSELGKEGKLWLFVVLRAGEELTSNLRAEIAAALRAALSPRHVPDEIYAIEQVPRTLSGKKLEVPIKRVLAGVPLQKALNPGTLQNPAALHSLLALLQR